MNRRTLRPSGSAVAAVLSVLLALAAFAGPPPAAAQSAADDRREVPEALVPVLNAAQRALEADDPRAALRILGSYEGPDDPLQQLLAGYAHMDIGDGARAEAAFRRALELDDTLEQARTGLARSLVAREKWQEAIGVLRTVVDVDRSSAVELGLYARAAYEAGDLRLASLLSERGLLRFPQDVTLRRIDVEVLIRREAWNDAVEAALGLLALQPRDGLAWAQLAAAADRAAPELAVPALEAATLVAPDRAGYALRLARKLYDLGDFGRVVELVEARLAGGAGDLDEAFRQLGVSAAVNARDWSAAAKWASDASSRDIAQLVGAHAKLEAGQVEAALDQFARVASRRRLPSDQLWSLAEVARGAERPALEAFFARATLARCDAWAPAAAAVLASGAERTVDPDQLLRASCGG